MTNENNVSAELDDLSAAEIELLAKEAAQAAGQPLDSWIAQAIKTAAHSGRSANTPSSTNETLLADLARRVKALQAEPSHTAEPTHPKQNYDEDARTLIEGLRARAQVLHQERFGSTSTEVLGGNEHAVVSADANDKDADALVAMLKSIQEIERKLARIGDDVSHSQHEVQMQHVANGSVNAGPTVTSSQSVHAGQSKDKVNPVQLEQLSRIESQLVALETKLRTEQASHEASQPNTVQNEHLYSAPSSAAVKAEAHVKATPAKKTGRFGTSNLRAAMSQIAAREQGEMAEQIAENVVELEDRVEQQALENGAFFQELTRKIDTLSTHNSTADALSLLTDEFRAFRDAVSEQQAQPAQSPFDPKQLNQVSTTTLSIDDQLKKLRETISLMQHSAKDLASEQKLDALEAGLKALTSDLAAIPDLSKIPGALDEVSISLRKITDTLFAMVERQDTRAKQDYDARVESETRMLDMFHQSIATLKADLLTHIDTPAQSLIDDPAYQGLAGRLDELKSGVEGLADKVASSSSSASDNLLADVEARLQQTAERLERTEEFIASTASDVASRAAREAVAATQISSVLPDESLDEIASKISSTQDARFDRLEDAVKEFGDRFATSASASDEGQIKSGVEIEPLILSLQGDLSALRQTATNSTGQVEGALSGLEQILHDIADKIDTGLSKVSDDLKSSVAQGIVASPAAPSTAHSVPVESKPIEAGAADPSDITFVASKEPASSIKVEAEVSAPSHALDTLSEEHSEGGIGDDEHDEDVLELQPSYPGPSREDDLSETERVFDRMRRRVSEAAKEMPQEPAASEVPPQPTPSEPKAPSKPSALDQPLEPGMGAPDLSALNRLASHVNEMAGEQSAPAPKTKADFIAAARKAAQMAAAEEEQQDEIPLAPTSSFAAIRDRINSIARGAKKKSEPTSEEPSLRNESNLSDRLDEIVSKSKDDEIDISSEVDDLLAEADKEKAPKSRKMLLLALALALAVGAASLFGNQLTDKIATYVAPFIGAEQQISQPADSNFQSADEATEQKVAEEQAASEPTAPEQQAEAPVRVVEPNAQAENTQPANEVADNNAVDGSPAASDQLRQPIPSVPQVAASATNFQQELTFPASITTPSLKAGFERGAPDAYFEIARRYSEGDGLPNDMAIAAKWYEAAAEKGMAIGQFRIGTLYEDGVGVKKDAERAAEWYLQAANQGNARSMHNLAVIFAEGKTGAPDFGQAAGWFTKAANLGVIDSQFNLGILYVRGLGVEKDFGESYKWFSLAANAGDRDAGAKRDEVARALSAAQLDEKRAEVEVWKAIPWKEEANVLIKRPSDWIDPGTVSSVRKAPINLSAVSAGGNSAPQNKAPAPKAVPDLMIQKAQMLLNGLGFAPGVPDGIAGPRTYAAVRAFQEEIGVPATGQINQSLIDALNEAKS